MWYEVLPVMAIIGTCLAMTQIGNYFTNKLLLGNPYKRQFTCYGDELLYLRDLRVSGYNSSYKQVGIDCLTEEPVEVVEKKKEIICIEKESV